MQPIFTEVQLKEYIRISIAFNAWISDLRKSMNEWIMYKNQQKPFNRDITMIYRIDILKAYDSFVSGITYTSIKTDSDFIMYSTYSINKQKEDTNWYNYKEFKVLHQIS